jgi:D-glycero-D-manno-heptose 1,7-bisphosphate phosphatase
VSRAVFLDRDGVLVRAMMVDGKSYAARRVKDFRLLPGARRAVEALRAAGYKIVVVTNQPDIGNGLIEPRVVEAMHQRLREAIAPDLIKTCPHRQDDGCECRKPKPGMLVAAAKELGINLRSSYMVGDRWSDVVAGQSAGCYTFFVDRGYRETISARPDCIVKTLPAAVDIILGEQQRGLYA